MKYLYRYNLDADRRYEIVYGIVKESKEASRC